ncbi:MAG: hypothetical protein IJ555_02825 [Ruminococcus sp.]|nr:hypothetical protein [Ruminococcus sp.]MBR1749412.1 hypothetical protein [Ruminococcus sp.]
MGLFSKKKKDSMSLSELKAFDKKAISYVVKRENGEEIILGRKGAISVKDDEIVIVCNGSEALRVNTAGAVMATLMSGNGVDIKGEDSSGRAVHAIAYYSNLRQ